jgi:predicted nucleic acid-binding protein
MILVDTSVIADILTKDPDWFAGFLHRRARLRRPSAAAHA